jgi:hypothetical protein
MAALSAAEPTWPIEPTIEWQVKSLTSRRKLGFRSSSRPGHRRDRVRSEFIIVATGSGAS